MNADGVGSQFCRGDLGMSFKYCFKTAIHAVSIMFIYIVRVKLSRINIT